MDKGGWSRKVTEMGWGTDKDKKGKKGGRTMTCAWRWGWSILHKEIFNLLRLAADSGYHPTVWRTLITVAIQKPNRDYSLPRSYRLIQLLEVIGKALE